MSVLARTEISTQNTAEASGKRVTFFAVASFSLWNYRQNLIREIAGQGYAVSIIAPDSECFDRLATCGASCHRVSMTRGGVNPVGELIAVLRIAKILRELKPDVLLTFTPKANVYGGLAARFLRIPTIANISGLGGGHDSSLTKMLDLVVRRLYRIALSNSSAVFFQNPDDRENFLSAGLVNTAQAGLLPGSGINLDDFQPEPFPTSGSPFTFLLASRLLWSKGVGLYAEAARILRREVPETRFLVLGIIDMDNPDGISREQINAWQAEKLIEFHEAVDDVRPFVTAADCAVLPSTYREGVPRSLLEAAAMGKPIITTDSPGCRSTVDDGVTGFLCEPNSLEDLADKLRKIRDLPPAQLQAMGDRSRDKVTREFNESIVVSRYLKQLREVLAS